MTAVVVYRSNCRIALERVDHTLGYGVRFGWLTFDGDIAVSRPTSSTIREATTPRLASVIVRNPFASSPPSASL